MAAKKKKAKPPRSFHAAKIGGRYRTTPEFRSLREINLFGLTRLQQERYLVGTIRKAMLTGIAKSKNGKVTVTFNFSIFYNGKFIVKWGDPSLLSSERDVDLYLDDAKKANASSWLSFIENTGENPDNITPGIQVVRINTTAGRVFKKI